MKKLGIFTLLAMLAVSATAAAEGEKDNFYWLGQINKATAVINTQQGLLTREQGQEFAKSIAQVLQEGDEGGARPQLVITFEPLLIKAYGSEEITMLAQHGKFCHEQGAGFRACCGAGRDADNLAEAGCRAADNDYP